MAEQQNIHHRFLPAFISMGRSYGLSLVIGSNPVAGSCAGVAQW